MYRRKMSLTYFPIPQVCRSMSVEQSHSNKQKLPTSNSIFHTGEFCRVFGTQVRVIVRFGTQVRVIFRFHRISPSENRTLSQRLSQTHYRTQMCEDSFLSYLHERLIATKYVACKPNFYTSPSVSVCRPTTALCETTGIDWLLKTSMKISC